MSNYPEHEKLSAVADESQAQGEFIEWLSNEHGIILAFYPEHEHHPEPVHRNIQDLLAEYHGIDRKLIEQEKRAMLDECRRANG